MSGIAGATVTGSGLVDGNGQAAYEKFASDSTYKRPTLWYITGSSSDITIKGLRFQNPPNVFHSVTGNSNNVIYSGLTMTAASKSSTAPKNTDGFDVGASTNVQILNTSVTNQGKYTSISLVRHLLTALR